MRLENDDVFNTLYNEEFAKIPSVFRFGKKRIRVVLIITVVLIVATLVLSTMFFESRSSASIDTLPGYSLHFTNYNYAFLIAMIITAVLVALLTCWMVLSTLFEKRAFAKASNLANMIYLSERHKAEVDHQNQKMLRPF